MTYKLRLWCLCVLLISSITLNAQVTYTENDFNRLKSTIYPIVKSSVSKGGIREKVYRKLKLSFGIENNNGFEIITKKTFPKNITPELIKNTALNNLETLVDNATIDNTNFGGKAISCGHKLESSLILVDWIVDSLEEGFDHGVLLAFPDNSSFYAMDNTSENKLKLKNLIAKEYTKSSGVSTKVYKIEDHKLKVVNINNLDN